MKQGLQTPSPVPATQTPAPPLVLDEHAVAARLDMGDLIDLMERALAEFSSGHAVQPVRTVLEIDPHDARLGVMPGYLPESGALGVKIVSVVPRNTARGLHTHLATILLIDPETGAMLAIMDGRLITAARTAAVSAAAARALAPAGTHTLGILGSGVQARSHLDAISRVRPLERVRVWSPTRQHREAFARDAYARHRVPVEAVDTAERAVSRATLVVAATASRTPVLEGRWLQPGTHVTAVGASQADSCELDAETVRRASVWVDSIAAARVEAGDLLNAVREGVAWDDHVRGEIGAVFAGTLPGRRSPDEITLFKSLGLAVEDAASARRVFDLERSARENSAPSR